MDLLGGPLAVVVLVAIAIVLIGVLVWLYRRLGAALARLEARLGDGTFPAGGGPAKEGIMTASKKLVPQMEAAGYKPAATPLIPWGSTTLPANAPANTVLSQYWDTNNVWIKLKNGNVQRVGYNPGLNPWRNQYVPGVRQWGLDASLFKNVRFGERLNVRLNADFFNVLNAPGNPNSIGGDGFLATRTSGNSARTLQLGARITW